MRLFQGYADAHGTHGAVSQNDLKGGKQEIKKSARTVREPVTVDLWNKHLAGDKPLGIIPIMADATCYWGCIDVDQYDINHGEIVKQLRQRKLPLVLCKTKSGGAHLFLFLSQPVSAEILRARLRQISANMGFGDSEIFPKQNQILADRGDLGNWLNMPYLGGDKTTRYGVKENGSGMSLTEFLSYAEQRRVVIDDVAEPGEPEDETLNDGPPCLQHLSDVGFPEGTRNNGLFGLGIFCKKKFGERWREMLEQYNRQFMVPPLPADEVMKTIQSLEKKDYQYKCKDKPCIDYCNSALCKTRKFGVGGAGKYPTISGISKLDAGENTLWFLDIEDTRIELNTRQLQNYREFQAVCMDVLTVFYLPMKADTWASMVGEAMQNATIIEPAEDVTVQGHFKELLEEFLTDRHAGTSKNDLFLGKPYLDPDMEMHYFRLRDLMAHLERRNFKSWGRNVIGRRIETLPGGGRTFFNVDGNGVNVYHVPSSMFSGTPQSQLPESDEDPV